MKVTFLIGNGFDLNLDLKTHYNDFLPVYTAEDTEGAENKENQKLLKEFKQDIQDEQKHWSDVEVAFGQYTQKMLECNKNAGDFCRCHEDFCEKLAEYLRQEEAKIDFGALKAKLGTSFAQSIAFRNIIGGFREESQDQLKQSADHYPDGFDYNFISFNYTSTLDKCIEYVRGNVDLLEKRTYKNYIYGNSIGELFHIHGCTDEDMVLGVNDESQISAPELFNGFGPEYKSQLIKQQTNVLNERGIDKKAASLISNSSLIYIYGMSIGATDALWWKRIAAAMKSQPFLRLIIHCHNAPKGKLIRREFQTFSREQKEKFLSFSDLTSDEKSKIMDRIHIDNSDIFAPLHEAVAMKPFSATEIVQAFNKAVENIGAV